MKLSLKTLFAITTIAVLIAIAIGWVLEYRSEQELRRQIREAYHSGPIDARDWKKVEKEEVVDMLSTPVGD